MGGALPERLRTAFERGGEMGRRMLALDWAATPLGEPHRWPTELAEAVARLLASKAQIVLFWGPERCALYNDAYIATMGSKHPGHLARPGNQMWAETWSLLDDLFAGVAAADEAFYAADHPFMLERHGFLEETYFDISYDPIRRADGTVGGVFCIVSDTTRRVLGDRRVRTLSRIGSLLTGSTNQAELGSRAVQVLAENRDDLPITALYLHGSGEEAHGSGDEAHGSGDDAALYVAGAEETADGERQATAKEAARALTDAARQVVDEVVRSGRPATTPLTALIDAPPPSAADEAFVLPVGTGALVVGVSRYLAPDDTYRDFLDLVAAQISRAVTNLRTYEEERRRAAELAVLNAAKTNFFSNVSHEFRTPLTLILGPLEDLLGRRELDSELRDRLIPMQRNGLRLLKLVNTVLDFSRLESGRLRAEFRPTDLADYTMRLSSSFSSAIERAGLELRVDCPPLTGPVHVDREMWEKIVFNLLSNALKFTRAGHITVRLREHPATAPTGAAVLEVEDTGAGVSADDQQSLFDRFHRVTGAWSRSHEGTGIGLSLVRELAEMHGGTATARSELGVGSTFTVTVPLGTAHLPADQIVAEHSAAAPDEQSRLYVEEAHWWLGDTGSEPGPPVPPGEVEAARQGRVLLVDDNADLRDHVARLLRPYWEVTTAEDGWEALEQARALPFDLVLTDVMMPRLDGFGLIEALRADERTRDVPIVMLSARAGEESSVEGLAAGADDYLVKPFSVRDLTAGVRANLELGQVRRQIISRLRGLVDAAAAVNTVRTTAEVLDVAARHVAAMTSAGRVVVTAPGARAEAVGGTVELAAVADAVLPLPDTSGVILGELSVWSGPDGAPEPVLLTQLARLIGLRLENARLYEAEHRIASTLQHSLLPQSLPRMPGAIVASRYLPGSSEAEVGGDWYDVIHAPGDQLFLVIGDVVGKGVQAAAGIGQLRNALRAYILEGFDCGEALTRLNRLVDNLGQRQFATVVCVRFDPRTRELHFSAAGHPSPVRAAPGQVGDFLFTSALGPPIGALGDSVYPTLRTELAPGDRLLLYTDGLVEDRRKGIDEGLAEVCADLAQSADHVEDLLDGLLGKAARHARRDDIALLALQVTEPRELELRLPADATKLTVLRRRVEDFLTGNQVPENDIFDLLVAVSEAAANAIEHPVDPVEPVVTVRVSLDEDAVTATVRDTGSWRPATGPSFRGRGLALIGALADLSVTRSEAGTSVTLRRPFSRA
ncbi:SpoIIE family protein phosphatase [Actinoplanes sp. NPDC051859]|uniref:SpoIIE family protein phosphatase n=1 Tax=Actinoplanes sp. NPDC051859 TaxID=3363909 RepID=UPI0037872E71